MEGVHEVDPEQIETLYTNGFEVPYVQYGPEEPALKLVHGGEDYWYVRTVPLKGYGAVMAKHLADLQGDGRKLILARYQERIYIYATGVTPIGTGKK